MTHPAVGRDVDCVISVNHDNVVCVEAGGDKGKFRLRDRPRELRAQLLTYLQDFVKGIRETNADTRRRIDVIRQFHDDAFLALDEFEDHERLTDFFQDHFEDYDFRPEPLMIELHGRGVDTIPLELLPLFRWRWQGRPAMQQDLIEASRSFVGLSCIVRRIDKTATLAPSEPLHEGAGLPLRFFWESSLPGADRERAFFASQAPAAIDLRGPWPDRPLERETVVDALARHIHNPALDPDDIPLASSDRVHHYSCHCDTSGNRAALRLGQRTRVTVSELNSALYELTAKERASTAAPPLVFINACGSAQMPDEFSTTFPQLYWKRQCTSIIGTEAKVPDRFAADFAERFYTLMREGATAGYALLHAKRLMLEGAEMNPLGLLYNLYGNPDLRWIGAPQ